MLLSSSSGGAAAGYLAGTQFMLWAQFFGMSRAERRCVSTVGRVVVWSGGSGLPCSSAAVCSPPSAPFTTTTVCCRTSSYVESPRLQLIGAVLTPAPSSTTTVAVRFRRRSHRAVASPLVTSHHRTCLLHRPRRPTHRRACSTS